MADTSDLGSDARNSLGVQVSSCPLDVRIEDHDDGEKTNSFGGEVQASLRNCLAGANPAASTIQG